MMVALGVSSHLSVADIERAAEVIASTKIHSTQLEIPIEVARAAMRQGREAGARILFDPAPFIPFPQDLLQRVDILKPDAKEAQDLTGLQVQNQENARNAAQHLFQQGVHEIIALQAGDEGLCS